VRKRAPDASFVAGSRGARTFPGDPAENYWFRRHQAAYALVSRALHDHGARRVLDVGCGEGYGTAMIESDQPTHALELDELAARQAAAAYPSLRVVRGDACTLPYRPRSFDAVLAMQVIEHLFCADGFLRQIREVLRPGGLLLLSTPNRETFSPAGEINAFHVYEYTAEELEALLQVHFGYVRTAGLHHGLVLRAADRAVGGSLQHRMMTTPFESLPLRTRTLVRSVRSRQFVVGATDGSLDLLATARSRRGGSATSKGRSEDG
jgi:SAM-dependent methyltransferase